MNLKFFSSPYCSPCKAILPKVVTWAGNNDIVVEQINVLDPSNEDEVLEHGVSVVPTVAFAGSKLQGKSVTIEELDRLLEASQVDIDDFEL